MFFSFASATARNRSESRGQQPVNPPQRSDAASDVNLHRRLETTAIKTGLRRTTPSRRRSVSPEGPQSEADQRRAAPCRPTAAPLGRVPLRIHLTVRESDHISDKGGKKARSLHFSLWRNTTR
ncbi:hypothetical protein F2P81_008374 [Scophthalmus maximus]|uniref:Uncharacterized protein n=1 Tax=Scophthalmus maximus TaxID=52904 RepID=A0A6A4T5D2_SCOMX|nr:hypothetical protein F2P81_008374 [Scophthalmus maximus]